MSKNTRNRILLTAIAALLLVAVAVGGTMAYLQATSNEVTNTFKPTGLSIDLNEHDYDPNSNTLDTNATPVKANDDYKVVPGVDIPKDPYVTFSSDVACYVFITVKETNWPEKDDGTRLMDYAILSDWTKLENGVYYQLFTDATDKVLDAAITDKKLSILVGDKVTVSTDITLTEMAAIKAANPTLEFDAFIIQQAGFADAAAAWTAAKTSVNP